mmetsp:Transcript_76715/g.238204  ORF Transcript_76715/g.238204 Transcript_76715/m.238204 type:complete len:90 (+) Transcript_76715:435-704(+)
MQSAGSKSIYLAGDEETFTHRPSHITFLLQSVRTPNTEVLGLDMDIILGAREAIDTIVEHEQQRETWGSVTRVWRGLFIVSCSDRKGHT